MLQSPHHPCQPVLELLLEVHTSLELGETRTGHSIPDVSHQYRQGCFLQPRTWMAALDILLACGQLEGHQGCQCPSLQSCFPASGLPACTGAWGHSYPGCRILHFPLSNLMRFLCPVLLPTKFPLNCSTSIWYITHSSEFCFICSIAELLTLPHHPYL